MTTGTNHNCHGCGSPMTSASTHCGACVRALRTGGKLEWQKEPATPAILRATPLSRGKDEETLPMFDEAVGARPHQEPDDKKRRPRRRKGSV